MNDLGEHGGLAPPVDPQLLETRRPIPSPNGQQVGLQTPGEAVQDRVFVHRRREDGSRRTHAEAVPTPFDASQVSLGSEEATGVGLLGLNTVITKCNRTRESNSRGAHNRPARFKHKSDERSI